jgi:hypothetical protein
MIVLTANYCQNMLRSGSTPQPKSHYVAEINHPKTGADKKLINEKQRVVLIMCIFLAPLHYGWGGNATTTLYKARSLRNNPL